MPVDPGLTRILFTAEQIEARVRALCESLTLQHNLSKEQELVLIPILNGAAKAAGKLTAGLKKLIPDLRIRDWPLHISRTRGQQLVPPSLKPEQAPPPWLKNKTLIIVDDLADKGETLSLAHRTAQKAQPKKIISCVLVAKRPLANLKFPPDYCGFTLDYPDSEAEKKWLYGYGMDIDGEYRDCDFIAEYLKD